MRRLAELEQCLKRTPEGKPLRPRRDTIRWAIKEIGRLRRKVEKVEGESAAWEGLCVKYAKWEGREKQTVL